jgi:hypothetical protein
MIESGERGGDLVFSQNFLAIAEKHDPRSPSAIRPDA